MEMTKKQEPEHQCFVLVGLGSSKPTSGTKLETSLYDPKITKMSQKLKLSSLICLTKCVEVLDIYYPP